MNLDDELDNKEPVWKKKERERERERKKKVLTIVKRTVTLSEMNNA